MQRALSDIEKAIRTGRLREARSAIRRIQKRGKLQRRDLSLVANLARRAGLPKLALRLLYPFVRPPNRRFGAASEREILEYGATLIRIGAVSEGLPLLQGVSSSRNPERLLYESFAWIARWDYEAAIPLLNRYLESPIPDYFRLIGEVNLASALLSSSRLSEAREAIGRALLKCERAGARRLAANCLELEAQLFVAAGNLDDAERAIKASSAILGTEGSADALSVRKWKWVIALRRDPSAGSIDIELAQLRSIAIAQRDWETLRECDFHQMVFRKNALTLTRLYHGTPFTAYRKRLLQTFGERRVSVANCHVRVIGQGEVPPTILDLNLGELATGEGRLKAGLVPLKVLRIVASDFYRPIRTTEIFSELFPEEHYNPDSSPLRVRQAVFRLNRWCSTHEIPLQVRQGLDGYGFEASQPVGLVSHLEAPPLDEVELATRRLALRFPHAGFSAKEASAALGFPLRTVQRILSVAIQRGQVFRVGRGEASFYRFVGKPAALAAA